jgi:aspartyl-tRNA(Asn)/glutamyl-tRNA(Gln) amidotransferase subunit A
MTEPWELTATEALARMRAKDLSPVELLASVYARADATEPVVNAFAERRTEEAVVAAKESERRYAAGEGIRPLEGLPVGFKEELPVEGWRMRYGSLTVDHVADTTAVVAERILAAGAVAHARTTTPEFSCTGYTHSKLWGITRNPWNPEVAVGGSSGGSAASLAAGTSLLATGSDIGGSIRIPASINGVVGFKPPHGRIPEFPPFNLDRYSHEGPLARTVADCALFENVLAGPHRGDMTSIRPKLSVPETFEPIDGLRIALSIDLGAWEVDDEVAANTRSAAEALREAGAIVDEVEIPWTLERIMRAARAHYAGIFGAEIAEMAAAAPDQVNDYVLAWVEESEAVRAIPGSFAHGIMEEAALWLPLGEVFETYDALICPTWSVTGILAGDSILGTLFESGGRNDRQFTCYLTTPFNMFSACPVLSVPSGVAASNGVPTGIQIVARTFDDVTAFGIGAALEQVRPWTGLAPFAA